MLFYFDFIWPILYTHIIQILPLTSWTISVVKDILWSHRVTFNPSLTSFLHLLVHQRSFIALNLHPATFTASQKHVKIRPRLQQSTVAQYVGSSRWKQLLHPCVPKWPGDTKTLKKWGWHRWHSKSLPEAENGIAVTEWHLLKLTLFPHSCPHPIRPSQITSLQRDWFAKWKWLQPLNLTPRPDRLSPWFPLSISQYFPTPWMITSTMTRD